MRLTTTPTAEPTRGRVHAGELVRGAWRRLPDLPQAARGLWLLGAATVSGRRSLAWRVAEWARRKPQATAVVDAHRRLTYREVDDLAARYAEVLRRRGVRRGDKVAVMIGNRSQALLAVTAIVRLGAVAGMLNPNQRGAGLAHSLRLLSPKLMLIGTEYRALSRSLRRLRPAVRLPPRLWLADGETPPPRGGADLERLAQSIPQSALRPPVAVAPQDPAFHILTSGTTGLPKASVMSHGRWCKAMAGVGLAGVGLRGDDLLYCALPIYHNNALTVSWGAVLGAGAGLALGRKFSASRFWDEIRAFDATAFSYIGELCRYLLARPASARDRDHRVRLCIGNGLRPELMAEFRRRFGVRRICEFYGASEANLAFLNVFDLDGVAGFCPLPYAVVEWDYRAQAPRRDARGRLIRVTRGHPGLLIAKVSRMAPFEGYTRAADNEAKLLRDAFARGDLWFNSGDLVRELGFRHIQFVDRVGDTFRWKGENVATTEVEAALNAFPQVAQSVVYGVRVPGAEGRAGMAAVKLRASARRLNRAGLARHLRQRLPAYAVPVFVRLVDAIEATTTFKSRRGELREQGWQAPGTLLLPRGANAYAPLDAKRRVALAAGRLPL